MNWLKEHWKIPTVVLALLLAWGLWYTRPVDIYALAPEVRNPDGITIDIEELTNVGEEIRFCSRPFTPEDPEWETVLSEVEALRFRRPVSNTLLQFLDRRSTPPYSFQAGDYSAVIRVMRQDGPLLQLDFLVDRWQYNPPHSSRNLPLKMEDGAEIGLALCRKYWSPPGKSGYNVSRETLKRY